MAMDLIFVCLFPSFLIWIISVTRKKKKKDQRDLFQSGLFYHFKPEHQRKSKLEVQPVGQWSHKPKCPSGHDRCLQYHHSHPEHTKCGGSQEKGASHLYLPFLQTPLLTWTLDTGLLCFQGSSDRLYCVATGGNPWFYSTLPVYRWDPEKFKVTWRSSQIQVSWLQRWFFLLEQANKGRVAFCRLSDLGVPKYLKIGMQGLL